MTPGSIRPEGSPRIAHPAIRLTLLPAHRALSTVDGMAYRLPPLNSLRLFEAAGRHLSFKAAAEELNLTPGAISHGVLTLEAWLGVDLFLRGNRILTLTAAGTAYLPQVRTALEMIVGASNAVPGRKPTGRLAVSVSPTFGVRWLLPRLVRVSDRHPDIEGSVDTNHRLVEFPRDGIDVAIRMGRGDWPGLDATCLVRETLVPVCAPGLAAGQLVAVLGPPRLCATGYWLVTEAQSRTRPEVAAFCDWIRRELGAAPDLPDGPVPRRGQLARMSR